jgi:putative transposase
MSRKRTIYSSALKTKLVLELLKNEQTLSQISSAYNVTPQNLKNWKKIFLSNAEIAMEPSKAVKEYKEELAAVTEQNTQLTQIVGKMTVEKEWLEKKLKSLGLSDRRKMIDPELKTLSLSRQCCLLDVSRSYFYYKPSAREKEKQIKDHLFKVFEEIPIYGEVKVHQQLLEEGCSVSLNTVSKYRKELGLRAVLAVRQVNTSVPVKEHKKYSYKLRGLNITHANHVWSTDITYCKTAQGMVYLAAVIDWHSKAILSHKVSNTMDMQLVMDVLNDALSTYGKPEIFNTDQGSQYTSELHTQRLKKLGICISMDGIGRATDNICIERFWRSAKCERMYLNEYASLSNLSDDVDDYIQFYNEKRFHQTLEYKKPMDVYRKSIAMNQALKAVA